MTQLVQDRHPNLLSQFRQVGTHRRRGAAIDMMPLAVNVDHVQGMPETSTLRSVVSGTPVYSPHNDDRRRTRIRRISSRDG